MTEAGHASTDRRLALSETYETRVTLRRVWIALLALGVVTAVGVLGYMLFEGWGFMDALYMTVITLTTVMYREVRDLDTSGQLWTMILLTTGVGTLFYAAVSAGDRGRRGGSGLLRKEEEEGQA